MEIKPVNNQAKYSFNLSEITEIKISDFLPVELANLGWNEALNEITRHRKILDQANIWSPYPIQAFCLGAAQAPSLTNVLSSDEAFISSIFQKNMNEYLKVKARYYLFPLLNSKYQSQAVAQLIIETKPDAKIGDFSAWVDALHNDELSPENIRDIKIASRKIKIQ